MIAFPITPFKSDLSLDVDGLRKNLAKLFEHPICAVVAAGGTGEMYSLTPAENLQVIRTTVEAARGRVPVIAGLGFGQQLAVELARAAADAGADGILAFPPYYPQADDEGMLAYYRAIGEATPLGMLIYSRDWANFSSAMVERLTAIQIWLPGKTDRATFVAFKRSSTGLAIAFTGSAAPATTWCRLITASAFERTRRVLRLSRHACL